MQSMFPGYRKKSEEEIAAIWRDAIFVFDTNVLLHVYRYKPELQGQLLDAWEAVKDRVWIPHQVALEYHRNYRQSSGEQRYEYKAMRNTIRNGMGDIERAIKERIDKNRDRFLSPAPDAIMDALKKGLDEAMKLIQQAESAVPDKATAEQARARIDALFTGRVGQPYSTEQQRDVYEEAARRFFYKTPPGFKDEQKGGADQFGDVVLWLQILDYARAQAEPKRPIIFVTDDKKADWWEGEKGDPALAQEMYDRAGVDFLQLEASQFLTDGKAQRQFSIEEEVIEEVREVSEAELLARKQWWAGISDEMRLPHEPFAEQLARMSSVPFAAIQGAASATSAIKGVDTVGSLSQYIEGLDQLTNSAAGIVAAAANSRQMLANSMAVGQFNASYGSSAAITAAAIRASGVTDFVDRAARSFHSPALEAVQNLIEMENRILSYYGLQGTIASGDEDERDEAPTDPPTDNPEEDDDRQESESDTDGLGNGAEPE